MSPFQWDRNDFHIVMRMHAESGSWLHQVVIQNTQGSKMDFVRMVPVAKAEGVVAVEPSGLHVASFRCRVKYRFHIIDS